MSKKVRQSNVELLRLVSMLYIVLYHFSFQLKDSMLVNIIGAVFHIGVVCFVMISGYFGIRPTFRKFLNLAGTIWFYMFGCRLVGILLDGGTLSLAAFNDCIWLLSIDSHWWFIAVYMQLFLLAPMLNAFVDGASKNTFRYVLCALAFCCVWVGFFRHGNICVDGKNIVSFIFIYLLGRYLRLYAEDIPQQLKSWKLCFGSYIALMAIVVAMICLLPGKWSIISMQMFYPYNSPGIYAISVLFFLLFLSFTFQSKFVNYLSSSTFAIFLIHGNPDINKYLYIDTLQKANGNLLIYLVVAIIVFLVCIVIDKVRGILAKPLVSLCDKYIPYYKK